MTAALRRETFKTSRLAEFCSQRELTNQTGHEPSEWPLVILKEAVDNALDACEEAGIAPVVDLVVDDDGISIADNGPGIPPETVAAMLDYTVRVSSREAYVSPTRGAQGNALKTILAMGFVLDGERGETVIESRGIRHTVVFTIDRIRQEPRVEHTQGSSLVKTGLRIDVRWPDRTGSILDNAKRRFLQITSAYLWMNPHLAISVKWTRRDQEIIARSPATNSNWTKWSPSLPTSPHWYDAERLGRLIGAKIAHAADNDGASQTVHEFIAEFRGLAGTAKGRDICETVGASRQSLSEFYGDGNQSRVAALLHAMQDNSREVSPRDLGLIGRDHLNTVFIDAEGAPESFSYKKIEIVCRGVPYVAECAFGRFYQRVMSLRLGKYGA